MIGIERKHTWCWGILGSQVATLRTSTLVFWGSSKANSFLWGWPSWTEVRYNKVLFESNSPQCQSGSILVPIQWSTDSSGILLLEGIGIEIFANTVQLNCTPDLTPCPNTVGLICKLYLAVCKSQTHWRYVFQFLVRYALCVVVYV